MGGGKSRVMSGLRPGLSLGAPAGPGPGRVKTSSWWARARPRKVGLCSALLCIIHHFHELPGRLGRDIFKKKGQKLDSFEFFSAVLGCPSRREHQADFVSTIRTEGQKAAMQRECYAAALDRHHSLLENIAVCYI